MAPELEQSYQPLPSRKILTDLVQQMVAEVALRWSPTGVRQGFPSVATVWVMAESAAAVRLKSNPQDGPAAHFQSAWNDLNDTWGGDPLARNWSFTWQEGMDRMQALVYYLTESGLLDLSAAEADAPTYWLTKEELGE